MSDDLSEAAQTILPVISEVTRKLKAVLEASPFDSLYAHDIALISREVVWTFPEKEQLAAAFTLFIIIQGLTQADKPTRELTVESLGAIQADILLASITGL